MHPNERLLDLESRANQSATATSAGAAYSEGILTERGATTDDGGFARVPKYWREQIKQTLASPERTTRFSATFWQDFPLVEPMLKLT